MKLEIRNSKSETNANLELPNEFNIHAFGFRISDLFRISDFGFRISRQRGFTLLEVLIAVFVVSWAFVALLGLHARGVQSVIRDQNRTRATLVAREVISTVEYTVATRGLQGLSNTEGASETYPDFRYQVEVTPTELEDVRMVIVRIAWDDVSPPAQVIYYVREAAAL